MPRRFVVILLTAAAFAATVLVLRRDAWPGSHPHAVERQSVIDRASRAKWADRPMGPGPSVTTLHDAINAVAERADFHVAFSGAAIAPHLTSADFERKLTRSVVTQDRTVGQVLDDALDAAGLRGQFAWTDVGFGAVVLDAVPRTYPGPSMATRVFDARAILGRPWSPGLWFRAMSERQWPGTGAAESALVDRLTRRVDPKSWRDRGGPLGRITSSGGQLVVTHTAANIAAVEDALWRIRVETLAFDAGAAQRHRRLARGGGAVGAGPVRPAAARASRAVPGVRLRPAGLAGSLPGVRSFRRATT